MGGVTSTGQCTKVLLPLQILRRSASATPWNLKLRLPAPHLGTPLNPHNLSRSNRHLLFLHLPHQPLQYQHHHNLPQTQTLTQSKMQSQDHRFPLLALSPRSSETHHRRSNPISRTFPRSHLLQVLHRRHLFSPLLHRPPLQGVAWQSEYPRTTRTLPLHFLLPSVSTLGGWVELILTPILVHLR